MAPREALKTAAVLAQSPAHRICVLTAHREIQETAAVLKEHRLFTIPAMVFTVHQAQSLITTTAPALTTLTTARTSTVKLATSLIIALAAATLTLTTARTSTVMKELTPTTQLAAA